MKARWWLAALGVSLAVWAAGLYAVYILAVTVSR